MDLSSVYYTLDVLMCEIKVTPCNLVFGCSGDADNAACEKDMSCSNSFIVQELFESRGGGPGLSILTSLLVSVDVKIY